MTEVHNAPQIKHHPNADPGGNIDDAAALARPFYVNSLLVKSHFLRGELLGKALGGGGLVLVPVL